jgi:LEA14-like dessication related protein
MKKEKLKIKLDISFYVIIYTHITNPERKEISYEYKF